MKTLRILKNTLSFFILLVLFGGFGMVGLFLHLLKDVLDFFIDVVNKICDRLFTIVLYLDQ